MNVLHFPIVDDQLCYMLKTFQEGKTRINLIHKETDFMLIFCSNGLNLLMVPFALSRSDG